MQTMLACDGIPNILGIFDFNYAPKLLLYSYTPIILVSLFLSLLILRKSGLNKRNFGLFGMILSFSLWSLNVMAQWLTVPASINMLEWMITPLLEIFIFIFAFYFVYLSINLKDLSGLLKSTLFLILFPIIVLTPTKFNTSVFDVVNCEANLGFLIKYLFVVEVVIIFLLIGISTYRYIKEIDKKNKQQILLYGISTSSFLIIFWLSNFFGELTQTYEINLWGPIGMVIFVTLLTFLIVRFKAFDIKLIGAQALVWALVILIGSQFFFIQSNTNKILTGVTLIISAIVGLMIIRSVKKEIAQKEHIEKIAGELKIANEGQENLIHIMNHQIKGFFGIARNIFAELLQTDDYGQMPAEAKPLLEKGLESTSTGVDYVQDILKGSSAAKGVLPYDMKLVNVKDVVSGLLIDQKEIAEKKGLSFASEVSLGDFSTIGDRIHLREAFKNLITNAIKYNDYNDPNRGIKIFLTEKNNKIVFSVRDTGIGIAEEDKPRLFKAGGMGKDSTKYNVESSGFGLAFVKGVAEAHKGNVGFKSNAPEKGTTFFMEIPIQKVIESKS